MPETVTAPPLRARDGWPLGERGKRTRRDLLDSLGRVLAVTPWQQTTMPQVAQGAGVTPGTAYQYFADLPHMVRELVADLDARREPIPPHLARILALLDWEAEHLPGVRRG